MCDDVWGGEREGGRIEARNEEEGKRQSCQAWGTGQVKYVELFECDRRWSRWQSRDSDPRLRPVCATLRNGDRLGSRGGGGL